MRLKKKKNVSISSSISTPFPLSQERILEQLVISFLIDELRNFQLLLIFSELLLILFNIFFFLPSLRYTTRNNICVNKEFALGFIPIFA